MNISRALQHPTQDPAFVQKLAVTSLVGMVPILNFALYGYALEHSKSVMEGRYTVLPNWDDIGAKFQRGLLLVLAQMAYLLPVFLIYGCFFIFIIGGAGLAGAANTRQQERDIAAILSVGSISIMCVAGLVALALSLLTPGVYRQFFIHGTFASCFKFGEVLAYTRRRIGDIVLAWLALGAIGLVVGLGSMVLSIIPCLGTLAVLAISFALSGYLIVVHAHLMGQMMLKDGQALASVPPAPPPTNTGG
jgi:hypothetical protein